MVQLAEVAELVLVVRRCWPWVLVRGQLVLVRGGTGAGAFPFDTGGVGSVLACMAGLVGRLTVWSFWIAEVTVVSALSNNCSTQAVSSSVGLSGVSEVLVP